MQSPDHCCTCARELKMTGLVVAGGGWGGGGGGGGGGIV